MNLQKINYYLSEYVKSVKDTKIPSVKNLYDSLGKEIMGRKIMFYSEAEDNVLYFNKSMEHKKEYNFIGFRKKEFYSQEIVPFYNERRFFCIRGNSDFPEYSDLIVRNFGIRDFSFDVGKIQGNDYLVEVNEIHLASINKLELLDILKYIL